MPRFIRIFLAACLYYSGLVALVRWWTLRSGQRLLILNYHQASGGSLRRHFLYLRRYYRILPLEQALEELYAPPHNVSQLKDWRPPLALTFDDGYYDNYTYGFPLACELQIPITIFLIPGYIQNGHRFWWLEGDYLLHHTQVDKVTIAGYTYHLHQHKERKALLQTIDRHVRYAPSVTLRETFLATVQQALAVSSSYTDEEKLLLPTSWSEVRVMEEAGWISFGAHTMHHPILGCLKDPAEIQQEVAASRTLLEKQLGLRVRTFAYPVGKLEHIGNEALQAVKQAGYDWALTSLPGFNTAQTDPYLLKRLGVDVSQHWLTMAAEISGTWSFFSRIFRASIKFLRRGTRQS